jgi:hypothetical protein
MNNPMNLIYGHVVDESVSHATLKSEHLMESFMNFIEYGKQIANPSIPEHAEWLNSVNVLMEYLRNDLAKYGPFIRMGHYRNVIGTVSMYWICNDEHDYFETESCAWLIDEMFDVINEASPDGYVFSAHIGNGSDFGFWSIEMMEETA